MINPYESPEPEPPIIKNILEGKAKISFECETDVDERDVCGKKWLGTSHTYKIDVGENRETFLTVWFPASYEQRPYEKQPEMQITIEACGKGMPLLSNTEILNKVFAEIAKQMTIANQAKERQ
jgi:hypothetical protein